MQRRSFLPQLTTLTLPGRMSMNYEERSCPKMHVEVLGVVFFTRRSKCHPPCLTKHLRMPGTVEQIHARAHSSTDGKQSHAFPRHSLNYISQVLTMTTKNLPHCSKCVLTVAIATERTGRMVCGNNKLMYAKKHHILCHPITKSWKWYLTSFKINYKNRDAKALKIPSS